MKNPILSDYFVNLTGIIQEKVDTEGIDFPEALKRFYGWAGAYKLYSFGLDGIVLEGTAKLHHTPFLFRQEQFHDMRKFFTSFGIPANQYMSSAIVRAFGVEPSRRGHEALHDVMTIVDGLRLLKQKMSRGIAI